MATTVLQPTNLLNLSLPLTIDDNLTFEELLEVTPTVKNTFINFDCTPKNGPRRTGSSVPASTRLCKDAETLSERKTRTATLDTDISTCHGSTCSEAGSEEPPLSSAVSTPQLPESGWQLGLEQVEPPPTPTALRNVVRLNSKAAAFTPLSMAADANATATQQPTDHYQRQISEVVRCAKVAMSASEHIMDISLSHDEKGYTMIIRPNCAVADGHWQTSILLQLARDALLDVAAASNCVYVLGYCAKPFNMRALGLEATLGAMMAAKTACWHVFKKGFCRHTNNCCKQHPVKEAQIQILVEGVQFNAHASFVKSFCDQVAELTLNVSAALDECPYVELVEAFKGQDGQGWTIEITPKGHLTGCEEYLMTLAKNSLFGATGSSGIPYIMGYASRPFVSRPNGFVTVLGDMQDESRVCWDLYSKGYCTRDCDCKWEHPECMMPLNVIMKEKSSLSLVK